MNEITVADLKGMLERKENFQLIDVREEFEYETSNLNGENIPLSSVLLEKDKIRTDIPVIIHCRSGKRSAQAIQLLQQDGGYENLSNLQGGILAWRDTYAPEMLVY